VAAPESATCHADISTASAFADVSRVNADVSVDMVNVDKVNGQRVNGVHESVAPPVSLTLRLTRGTHMSVRVKRKKENRIGIGIGLKAKRAGSAWPIRVGLAAQVDGPARLGPNGSALACTVVSGNFCSHSVLTKTLSSFSNVGSSPLLAQVYW